MSQQVRFSHPDRPVIGLNGRFLVAKRTGVQRTAYRLFRSIIEQGDRFNFILFSGASEVDAPEWKRENVIVIPSVLSSRRVLRNHVWEQFVLPFLVRRHGVDILHSPANLSPFLSRVKSVVNIHDVCFLVQPAWFSWTFRLIYSWLVPRIAKRANVVLTNSNNSKNDILEKLEVDVSAVRLVSWAVEPMFFEFNRPFLERSKRILFVGSIEPRKNLSGLLEAFRIFKERHRSEPVRLTVVGCENALFSGSGINMGNIAGDVDFAGYLSDRELAEIYGDSIVLVYPSFYEGFGLPPLEAMAAGTPVITSNRSSLPEVVGDTALLVDPIDPEEIAAKIEMVYFDPTFAQEMARRGLKRVRRLSWDNAGAHVLDIYDELLASKK